MIRLESITIERFRGIREGKLNALTDVNLLIGRNNSGKSTVAEAITRAIDQLAGHHGRDPIGRSPAEVWTEIRKNPGPPSPEGWYKLDTTKQVALGIKIDDLDYSVTWAGGGNLQEALSKQKVRASAGHPIMQFAMRLTMFRSLEGINQGIENALWATLLSDRRDKALTRALNEIFMMEAEQLQLLPDHKLILLFADYSLPLDVQGDGARSALRCLMMMAAVQGTLFIVEEPECHQHPGSLERFARVFCRLARERQVQLVISTHSAECVRAFLAAALEAKSDSAVFHLTLDKGALDAKRLDPPTVETLQSTGVDVRYLDLYA